MKGTKGIYILCLFYIVLIVQLVLWALSPRLVYPEIISDELLDFSFSEYSNLFIELLLGFRESFQILLGVIIVNLCTMIPIAYFLAKKDDPLLNKLSLLLYFPLMAPALLPALGLYGLFIDLDLLGTKLGIILVQSSFLYPYMLRPIEISLRESNFKYERIAYDIGEGRLRTFFKITLPNLINPISFGMFLTLVGSFNDYIVTFLIGDTQIKTLPIILYPLMLSDNRSSSSIAVIMYCIPIILLVLLINRSKRFKTNA